MAWAPRRILNWGGRNVAGVRLTELHLGWEPAGPLYFYAALFEPGTLSPETLASNGAVYEFWLGD